MREGNVRTAAKERLAVTLDGKQIASVVVGALVILSVVFVLGLNVGRQIGARQAQGPRASLDALDSAPKGPAVPETSLTYHDRLTQATPEDPPAAAPASPRAAEPKVVQPPPEKVAAAPPPAEAKPVAEPSPPAARPAATPSLAPGAYTIQLGASSDRGEADRIAARFEAFRPRVEAAELPGKGRVYRVRVGSFETREAADRYLADVTRETGAKGWVTAGR
jgi:cell division septation protein DedD